MTGEVSEEAKRPNIWTSLCAHTPSAKTVVPGMPCGMTPRGKFTSSVYMNGTPWIWTVHNPCCHTLQPWWPHFFFPCVMKNSGKLKNDAPTLVFLPSLRENQAYSCVLWSKSLQPSHLQDVETYFQSSLGKGWKWGRNGVDED